jgi:hypothetical protein
VHQAGKLSPPVCVGASQHVQAGRLCGAQDSVHVLQVVNLIHTVLGLACAAVGQAGQHRCHGVFAAAALP